MSNGLRRGLVSALGLLFCSAAIGCAGGNPTTQPPSSRCVRGEAAAAEARSKEREALAFTRAAFEKAAAARGFKVIDLELSAIDEGRMPEAPAEQQGNEPIGRVFSQEIDGKKITYYRPRESSIVGAAGPAHTTPFLLDETGGVHEILHKPRTVSKEQHTLCGCGAVGSGMAQRPQIPVVKLPEGSTIRGAVEIAYDMKTASVVYNEQTDDGQPCPQPP